MNLLLRLAGMIVLLDQVTKLVVATRIAPGFTVELVPGLLWLTHRQNTGAAFSLFTGQTTLLVLVGVACIILVAALWRYLDSQGPGYHVGLGLGLGGAVGNLIDRVRVGAVIDWIEVPYWPVFNLADSAIVIGVGILLWQLRKA